MPHRSRKPPKGYCGADAILAVHAKEDAGQWQGKWRFRGWAISASRAIATGVRSVGRCGAAVGQPASGPTFRRQARCLTGLLVQVQGMTLERYAQLLQLLDPFGVRLSSVDGDKVVFEVSGSTDQLRLQLSLAKLQEVPAASSRRNTACWPMRLRRLRQPMELLLNFRHLRPHR